MNGRLKNWLCKPENCGVFSGVEWIDSKQYSVTCFACEQKLSSPSLRNVLRHCELKSHQDYCDTEPTGGLTAKQTFLCKRLMHKFDFLVAKNENVVCKYCHTESNPSQWKITTEMHPIDRHSKQQRHLDNARKATLSGEEYEEEIRLRAMRFQVNKYPTLLAISDEHTPMTDDLKQAGPVLYCIPCKRSLNPKDVSNYSTTVTYHLDSDYHEKCHKASRKRKRRSKKKQPDAEPNPLSPDQRKVHSRFISDEQCDRALQALIECGSTSMRSCSTSCQSKVRNEIGRDISATTLWERAFPKTSDQQHSFKRKR